jgi:hypothetical protein
MPTPHRENKYASRTVTIHTLRWPHVEGHTPAERRDMEAAARAVSKKPRWRTATIKPLANLETFSATPP